MKHVRLLAALLLIGMAAFAQDKKPEHRTLFAVQGGVSSPLGSFRNDDVLDEGAGLADKLGGLFKIDFQYFVEKDFGVAANFFIGSHRVIDAAFEAGLVPADPSRWEMLGFFAGPAFSRSFTKRLTGEFRMMGGLVNVATPWTKYEGLDILKDKQWTAGIQATGQLRYRFGKRMYSVLNVDYMHVNPKFKLDAPVETTHKQDISVINGTFGLGFYLGGKKK